MPYNLRQPFGKGFKESERIIFVFFLFLSVVIASILSVPNPV